MLLDLSHEPYACGHYHHRLSPRHFQLHHLALSSTTIDAVQAQRQHELKYGSLPRVDAEWIKDTFRIQSFRVQSSNPRTLSWAPLLNTFLRVRFTLPRYLIIFITSHLLRLVLCSVFFLDYRQSCIFTKPYDIRRYGSCPSC